MTGYGPRRPSCEHITSESVSCPDLDLLLTFDYPVFKPLSTRYSRRSEPRLRPEPSQSQARYPGFRPGSRDLRPEATVSQAKAGGLQAKPGLAQHYLHPLIWCF